MRNLYQKKAQKRTIILALLFMLWLSGLVLRLIQLQIFEHPRLKAKVLDQNQNKDTIHPKRGTIYDCKMNILARSVPRQSVFYTPFKSEPTQLQIQKLRKLKKILALSESDIQKIKRRIEKNNPFIWIKRKIEPGKEKIIQKLSLNGIHFLEENKRFYPQGKLAAQLLGRVNIDNQGASGVELRYNSILAGEEGERLILRDAKRRKYRLEVLKEPQPGKDLVLTIDEAIQYYAEKALKNAVMQAKAKWGTIIISQPATGEILAMANYPTFNPNTPPKKLSTRYRNKAIHYTYEPGSTFKIITASTALESGQVSVDETFDCSTGFITVGGWTIRDHLRFGVLTFPEVIIHSSNVGTIKIGQSVDKEIFAETIKSFGFGQKTGIDLPAEERGIFRPLKKWSVSSQTAISIGYEVSVTPLQMLQALNIVANKGVIIPPKTVKEILAPSEESTESYPQSERVLSEKTASTVASILQKAILEGTGKAARIKGYSVAGKTGTTQKIDPSTGRYSSTAHTASFVGYAPAEYPVLSMIVVLDDPQGFYYGGQVAAPVFQEVASLVLRYLHIPQHQETFQNIIAENQRKVGER